MICAGLKKMHSPQPCPPLVAVAANSVMGMDEVLLTKMTSGSQISIQPAEKDPSSPVFSQSLPMAQLAFLC